MATITNLPTDFRKPYDLTTKPAPDAIVRDWTDKTLVVDVTNSLGETFHFEVEPYDRDVKGRGTSHAAGVSSVFRIDLKIHLPIAR